jgi:hypothetical protein
MGRIQAGRNFVVKPSSIIRPIEPGEPPEGRLLHQYLDNFEPTLVAFLGGPELNFLCGQSRHSGSRPNPL